MEYPLFTEAQLRIYLKSLRLKAGYSQHQLGELLGMSQQGYQALERDPGKTSFSRIWQVLQILNASLVIRDKSESTPINEDKHPVLNKRKKPKQTSANLPSPTHQSEAISAVVYTHNQVLSEPLTTEKASNSSPVNAVVVISTPTGKKVEW